MNKNEVMNMMDYPVNTDFTISQTTGVDCSPGMYIENTTSDMTCWGYWRDWYYPQVIRESYPVYITERAKDKGKQAFEIIKVLKDKKLVKIERVGQFIDIMDELIKIL